MSKQDKDLKDWVTAYSIDLNKHIIPPILDFERFPEFLSERKKILFGLIKGAFGLIKVILLFVLVF